MASTRLTKFVIIETDFPPYFSIAGFDSLTVATLVLRDRGITDQIADRLPILMYTWGCT